MNEVATVRDVGLTSVDVAHIDAARGIVDVSAVQASLSLVDPESVLNGEAEYCLDHGIEIIAYRPLGGRRGSAVLARDPLLAEIAERLGATPQEIAWAWLLELAPGVVPIPGATREATAASIGRALTIRLDD